MLGTSTHIDPAHIRLELLNGLVQSCGKPIAMYMIRILVKLVLGIHVFLGFMWGGKLAYKSKD